MPKIYDAETKERAQPFVLLDAGGLQITTFGSGASPSTTGAVTSVSDAATNQTLLSSNASRKGFRLYNDSTATAYVKYGTTATSSDFTSLMLPGAYLEEDNYAGRVDCIWASDQSGAMRITELT